MPSASMLDFEKPLSAVALARSSNARFEKKRAREKIEPTIR